VSLIASAPEPNLDGFTASLGVSDYDGVGGRQVAISA
jgi:hypothetical protein